MSNRKQRLADFLFGSQFFLVAWSTHGQLVQMTTSAAGVSVSWLVFWLIFLAINLRLVKQADRIQPSRVMRQTIWSYRLSFGW